MKRLFGWMIATAVLTSATAVFAGCGSCPSDTKAKSDKPCCVALQKVKLTDEQKAKVATLLEECKGISCPIATQKKMAKELKGILTDQQYQQWEKACAAAQKSSGCCSTQK